MGKCMSPVLEFLRRYLKPDLFAKIVEHDGSLDIPLEGSMLYLSPSENTLRVVGRLAESAMSLGKRSLAEVAIWNREGTETFIKGSPAPGFLNQACIVALFLVYLPDIDMSHFFRDKKAIVYVNTEKLEAVLYVADTISLLIASDSSGMKIVKEVTGMDIKDFEDIDKEEYEKLTEGLARKALEEEKQKKLKAAYGYTKGQPVYGEPVEVPESK